MPSIDAKLTFGLELEVVRLTDSARELMARRQFTTHFDRSIKGRNGEDLPESVERGGGCELVTAPITVGVKSRQDGKGMTFQFGESERIVQDLCDCAAEVNKSCGLHIHIGRPESLSNNKSAWEPERTRTFLAIGIALEERLFNLCPPSRRGNDYCRPIRRCYNEAELGDFYPMGTPSPNKYSNTKRYCWLNTVETRRDSRSSPGTIEIRMLGSVRRFDYVWAWAQLWLKIGAYVAYTPSSLAMMHCCFAGSLEEDFRRLERVKNERDSRVITPDVAAPAPAKSEPEEDATFARDRRADEAAAAGVSSSDVSAMNALPIVESAEATPRHAARPPRSAPPSLRRQRVNRDGILRTEPEIPAPVMTEAPSASELERLPLAGMHDDDGTPLPIYNSDGTSRRAPRPAYRAPRPSNDGTVTVNSRLPIDDDFDGPGMDG